MQIKNLVPLDPSKFRAKFGLGSFKRKITQGSLQTGQLKILSKHEEAREVLTDDLKKYEKYIRRGTGLTRGMTKKIIADEKKIDKDFGPQYSQLRKTVTGVLKQFGTAEIRKRRMEAGNKLAEGLTGKNIKDPELIKEATTAAWERERKGALQNRPGVYTSASEMKKSSMVGTYGDKTSVQGVGTVAPSHRTSISDKPSTPPPSNTPAPEIFTSDPPLPPT